jgi:methane/ammonia monooxygenase subunit B
LLKPHMNMKSGNNPAMVFLVVTIIAGTASVLGVMLSLIPDAEGHGVQAQLQSRFVRINNEAFSAQSLHTGDTLVVTGELQSLVNRDLRGWISLFSESTNAGNRWEFVSRDPPGNIINVAAQEKIPYRLEAKALEPGIYHVHTQLNLASVGPGLGPGQTVQVTGEPILKPIPYMNIIYQSIIIAAGLGVTFATRPWQVI